MALTVVRNRCGQAGPAELVERAKRSWADLKKGGAGDSKDKGSVWVLIDREHTPECQAAADRAKEANDKKTEEEKEEPNRKGKSRRYGPTVLLSNPCYEVWTLLHLEDTGTSFNDCSAVIARIKNAWQRTFKQPFGGKKAQADYAKILGERQTAAKRARQHHENGDPSWTEIYKLSEEIDSYLSS